jgi:tetratricopeptide (TPR) repeat protein
MWTFDNALRSARKNIQRKKYKNALYTLRKLEGLDPNDSIIRFEIARCLINIDELKKEGKELLVELLETDNREYAMFELGKIEVEQGNEEQAWIYFEELTKTDNNKYALFELAKLQIEQGLKEEAKKSLDSLLDTDNREYALFELAKLSIAENNIEEAKQLFNSIGKNIKVLSEMIFLYIRNLEYEKAYEILINNNFKSIWDISQYCKVKNYLRYNLGLISKEELPDGYFYSQLSSYNEEKALEHIKLHLDENDNKRKHTKYDRFVNIDIIYNDIKYRIVDMNPIVCSIGYKYIIDYDYIVGEVNGCITDKLHVITLPNTNNIITMYPVINIKENIKIKQLNK